MRYLRTILLFLLLWSCKQTVDYPVPDRDTAASVQTDKLKYELRQGEGMLIADISQQFTNPRSDTVYIVNCNRQFALKLQKQVDGEWKDAFAPVLPECLSPAIEIPPQDEHHNTLNLRAAPSESDTHPRFRVEQLEGVYRLVWVNVLDAFNLHDYPFGNQLPIKQRVFNRFVKHLGGD